MTDLTQTRASASDLEQDLLPIWLEVSVRISRMLAKHILIFGGVMGGIVIAILFAPLLGDLTLPTWALQITDWFADLVVKMLLAATIFALTGYLIDASYRIIMAVRAEVEKERGLRP